MQSSTDGSALPGEVSNIPRRRGPWWSSFVGGCAGAFVAFIWAADASPAGSEGLQGVASFFRYFDPALPRAIGLGVVVVMLANKLVTLAPDHAPWGFSAPPPATIDGHYKASWLAAFFTPFVVVPVFGLLPLAILSWWTGPTSHSVDFGSGSGAVVAAGVSLALVPRLGRAVLREVDARVHARRA